MHPRNPTAGVEGGDRTPSPCGGGPKLPRRLFTTRAASRRACVCVLASVFPPEMLITCCEGGIVGLGYFQSKRSEKDSVLEWKRQITFEAKRTSQYICGLERTCNIYGVNGTSNTSGVKRTLNLFGTCGYVAIYLCFCFLRQKGCSRESLC